MQYHVLTSCYKMVWWKRSLRQHLMQTSHWTNHTLSSPYSHSLVLHTDMQDMSIDIRVNVLLKLNLTINKLDIERSLLGCVNGKLNVSIS